MGTRLLKLIVAVVVAAGLLVTAWPQFFGLEDQAPFAQLISFRLGGAIAAVLGASVLLLLGLLTPSIRRFTMVLAAMVVVFALALTATQGVRGFASAEPRPHRLADLRILSWNTQLAGVAAEDIVPLAVDGQADVIALQEVTPELSQAVTDALAAAGRPMTQLFGAAEQDPTLGTALLISTGLGDYTADSSRVLTGTMPSVVARSSTPGAPVLVSAHVAPPSGSLMRDWRSDLTRLAALCTAEPDVLIAGDFNSTLEHWSGIPGTAQLGACSDAGSQAGGAAVATWPTAAPSWLGAAIDHVAFSGHWDVSGYEVLDDVAEASDHRPILVQLSVQRMTKELH
ncbi:endonuclease/exonuclease/phosphatase family protein [Microbacteriaceae bacterium VKM Ac-2854]|nr:endonuclease/exonuclease/phosphatase family protein [Microbacteriaceae bacterium VKM Ac-2854]